MPPWRGRTLDANLFGPWRVTQALLPLLRTSRHGRIINVSSGAGSHSDQQFGLTTGGGALASYGISKAALNALTAKLAAEFAGSGILVNSVCPGLTATAPGIEAMGTPGRGGSGERDLGGPAARQWPERRLFPR